MKSAKRALIEDILSNGIHTVIYQLPPSVLVQTVYAHKEHVYTDCGYTRCSYVDKWNLQIGIAIARGRAAHVIASRIMRRNTGTHRVISKQYVNDVFHYEDDEDENSVSQDW